VENTIFLAVGAPLRPVSADLLNENSILKRLFLDKITRSECFILFKATMNARKKLTSATLAVLNGEMSSSAASTFYGVSHTTLRRHVANPSIGSKGRPTKFTEEEELTIVDLLLKCKNMGVPLGKDHLMKVVIGMSKDKGNLSICMINLNGHFTKNRFA